MKIPVYSQFQAAPQVQPGANFQAQQSIDPGAQMRQTGQALMQAGGAAAQIANDMQQQVNQTRVNDAMNRYIKTSDEIRTNFMARRGKAAFEPINDDAAPIDHYNKLLKTAADDLEAELGNEAQKIAFRQNADRNNASLNGTFNAHLISQKSVYENEVSTSTISISQDRAGLLYSSDEAVAESDSAIVASINNLAITNEWDDKTKELKLQEAKSGMHTGVIKGWLDSGNAGKAEEYYKQKQHEMTLNARANLQQSIYQSAALSRATVAVQDAIAPLGNDWTVQAVDRELAKKYAGKPDELKMARQELHYQDGIRKAAMNDLDAKLLGPTQNAVATAMNEGRFITKNERNALINVDGLNLSPKRRLEAIKLIDDHNNDLIRRNQALADRADALKMKNKNMNASALAWDMQANPKEYKGVDITPVLNSRVRAGLITPSEAIQLKDVHKKLFDVGQPNYIQTADKHLESALAGSVVFGRKFKTLSKEQQMEVKGGLAVEIDTRITELTRSGIKVTDEAIRKLVDQTFTDKTISSWFSPDVVVKEYDPEHQKAVSGIPAVKYAEFVDVLRRMGKPVTTEHVMQLWAQENKKGK